MCRSFTRHKSRTVAAQSGDTLVILSICRHDEMPPTHSITLAALVRLQYSREDVYEVMETARKLRINPSLTFLNSCIRALGDHNDVYGACQVMDRIKALETMEPDVISYNSLVYALVQEPWVSEVSPSVSTPEVCFQGPNDSPCVTNLPGRKGGGYIAI